MLFCCFILSAVVWIIIMLTDRRTAGSGFFLLLSAFLLGCLLISEALQNPEWFSDHFFVHILLDAELLFLAVLLVAYPMVLIPVFLIGGMILMKREGIRPRNVLSVGLAGLLIAFDIIFPMLFDVTDGSISTIIYWYITIISIYFVIHLASFWISDLINLIHFRKDHKLDYIVVLGAGLSGTKPTPLLAARIDKGISVHKDNPGSKLVFSGGQGPDELLPEARAMADYALSKGIPEEDILLEERSKNTDENIRFSAGIIKDDVLNRRDHSASGKTAVRTAVVTSSYHLMRSLMTARRNRLSCIGYGAHTRLYFSLNAFLREYAGYFRDTRRIRIVHLVLLTVIYALFAVGMSR